MISRQSLIITAETQDSSLRVDCIQIIEYLYHKTLFRNANDCVSVMSQPGRVMKYVYVGSSIQQLSWDFGMNHYDVKYKEMPFFTFFAMGNKNVGTYLQNQYGMMF